MQPSTGYFQRHHLGNYHIQSVPHKIIGQHLAPLKFFNQKDLGIETKRQSVISSISNQ